MEAGKESSTHFRNTLLLLVSFCCVALSGCNSGQTVIPVAEWDPEAMADKAMADLDQDGDGTLTQDELTAAPGLKYASKSIDSYGNNDGNLSRDEIKDRLAKYLKLQAGLTSFDCTVKLGKKPLVGATVRLVPEPFIGAIVPVQETTTGKGGSAQFLNNGVAMSVVPVCMYRVEITSPSEAIPDTYNTRTTLGVEVAGIEDEFNPQAVVFEIKQ